MAGYSGAIRAARLGARVALVENRELGGTCLNRGCIPTKSLIASVEAMEKARKGGLFGFQAEGIGPDFARMVERKNEVVKRLVLGVEQLVRGNGIEWVAGKGELVSKDTVKVSAPDGSEKLLKSPRILLATGSEPLRRPAFGIDGVNVLTSDEALQLRTVPKSLLIIGAGAVGVEYARLFRSCGAGIIVAEMESQVLPGMDARLAQVLSAKMKKNGIDVRTGSPLVEIRVAPGMVTSVFENGTAVQTEKVLVSTGRSPNSKGMGLEQAGIETEGGFIRTNDKLETSIPGIYAAGDVAGKWLLAYTAVMEGVAAAENAMGRERRVEYRAVPVTVFSDPEIACVGLTEKQARENGMETSVGRFLFAALGKALALDETEGYVSIVADKKTGEVLGGQIAGPQASNLIQEIVLAVRLRLKAADLAETLHSHPTLVEALMEAACDVNGEAIHKLRK
jgi:dihydrolipoamide dehydrogenase